jgi:glycosyltransferase involved in cell wall biosynthesis
MKGKRVLIITYYWPPSGGSGVQRWVKFAKYLREFGWEPLIYTVSNPNYPVLDPSMGKDLPEGIEVLKSKIFEPFELYNRFKGNKKDAGIQSGVIEKSKNGSWKDKIALWIRSNIFIPDARMFWIKSGTKFIFNYIKENPVDLIVTNGPPHSAHLIGVGLKNLGIKTPWVADFRDPWDLYYKSLNLSQHSFRKQEKLEKEVVQHCDALVNVGDYLSEQLSFKHPNFAQKFKTVYNGFDLDMTTKSTISLDQKFSIVYVGTFTDSQNCQTFWKTISEKLNEKSFKDHFELKLIGKIDPVVLQSIDEFGLNENTKFYNYLPHQEAITFQKSAQVLLLVIHNLEHSKSFLSGKVFEYMSAKRPIFAIGPCDGDASKVLKKTNSGKMHDYLDAKEMRNSIDEMFAAYLSNNLIQESNDFEIQTFHRKHLTKQMAEIFDAIAFPK